jgi:hypothetical protein
VLLSVSLSLSHVVSILADVPVFHSRNETVNAGFQTPRSASPHGPHSEVLPDMGIQGCKRFRACRNPVSSLCQSSFFSAINMSVHYTIHKSYEWKPNLT